MIRKPKRHVISRRPSSRPDARAEQAAAARRRQQEPEPSIEVAARTARRGEKRKDHEP